MAAQPMRPYREVVMSLAANQETMDCLKELHRGVLSARDALASRNPDRADAILYQTEKHLAQALRNLTVIRILR